jgi:hypothetical protein
MKSPGEQQGHGIHDHVDPDYGFYREFCPVIYHSEKEACFFGGISEW